MSDAHKKSAKLPTLLVQWQKAGRGEGVKCQNQPLPVKTTVDLHIGWLCEGEEGQGKGEGVVV
jgi:hypothetical protein